MNCNTSSDSMMRYFDGNINDIEKLQMKQHLKSCKKCREEFESLNEIFNCLEKENQIEPPMDFEAQVMQKVSLYEDSRRKKFDGFLMLIYGVTLFVLGVLTIIFIFKIKDSEILNSIGQMKSIQSVFWSIVYFAYGLFAQISGYLKGILEEMVYYYIFAVGLITYLILQKSAANTEKNVNNS